MIQLLLCIFTMEQYLLVGYQLLMVGNKRLKFCGIINLCNYLVRLVHWLEMMTASWRVSLTQGLLWNNIMSVASLYSFAQGIEHAWFLILSFSLSLTLLFSCGDIFSPSLYSTFLLSFLLKNGNLWLINFYLEVSKTPLCFLYSFDKERKEVCQNSNACIYVSQPVLSYSWDFRIDLSYKNNF